MMPFKVYRKVYDFQNWLTHSYENINSENTYL